MKYAKMYDRVKSKNKTYCVSTWVWETTSCFLLCFPPLSLLYVSHQVLHLLTLRVTRGVGFFPTVLSSISWESYNSTQF